MEGMLMLLVMMIITMVLTWALNGEQRKRTVSLLLCAAMMSSYIPAINVARADSIAKPVLVNEQVLVNGTKATQIGAVTYSASGSAYTLDTSSARVRVKNGDSISFDGAISAPEGEMISWVRVDIYDANTEEPYTVGAEYYRASGMKVQEFDLASIPALTIGEAFGSKDYILAEGGKYIVMFCVGDSNGNTFADKDEDIEDDQGPAILVDVKLSPSNCKHPHSDYRYVRHSSGEIRNANYGDALTHQVEPLYERYCGLCDSFLMNIWGQGTPEEHTFGSNGVCLACGYYAAPMMMSNGLQTAAIEGDITITEAKYIDEEGISVFWDCSNNACMYFRIEASIGGDVIFEETRKRNLTGSQNVLIPYDDLILGEECEIYIEGIAENSISAEAITEGDTIYVDIPEGEFLNITDPSNLELEFGAEEESQMIYFEASGRWTAECDDDWVTLSKTSGGSNVVAIEVTVDANDEDVGVERETSIYIALSSGSLEEEIYVYQEGREMTNYEKFQAAVDDLEIDYASGDSEDAVTADVGLPETGLYGVTISWESSNTSIIDDEGTVTRPSKDTEVELIATLSYYQYTEEKIFDLIVLADKNSVVEPELDQSEMKLDKSSYKPGDTITISGIKVKNTASVLVYTELDSMGKKNIDIDVSDEWTTLDDIQFSIPESERTYGYYYIGVRAFNEKGNMFAGSTEYKFLLTEEVIDTITLSADKTEINAGETVTFTAQSNADSVTLYIEAYNEVAGEWYVAVTEEMTKNGSEFTYTHEFANAGSKRVYAETTNSTTSEEIEITVNALKETLEAPVGGTMTAIVGEEVTISWDAVANATGYTAHLYEMVDGKLESIGDVTSLISGTSLKYTFTEAGEYHVGVIATAEGYNPSEQSAVIVTVEEATETITLSVDKTEINAGDSVTFTAQSNADSVTLYIEAYNEVAGEWYVAVTEEMTKNDSEFTYTHEFANAGSKRVYAKTANGTSSDTIEITANALQETLEAPVGGTMTAIVGEEVTISWGTVTNATGYTAHLYEMVDGKLESIGDVTSLISGTSLKYTFTESGEYHVGVIATAEGYNPSEQGAVIVTVEAATSVPDTQSPVIDPITSTVASPITAGTEVTFSTTAADDVELAKIELFIDGELKKTETVSGLSGTISYTTSELAIGEHTVMVVATDASGLTNNVSLTVTVQKANSSTCAHQNTTVIPDPQYVSINAEQHKLVYTYWTHCLDCDTGLSNVQDEDLPEKHTWKDGACEDCKHVCMHPEYDEEGNANYKNEVYSSTVSIKNNNDGKTHTHTYVVKRTCLTCEDIYQVTITDEHEEHNKEGSSSKITYPEITSDQHKKVTTYYCGCGDVVKVSENWENHYEHRQETSQWSESEGAWHTNWKQTTVYCECGGADYGEVKYLGWDSHQDLNRDKRCDACDEVIDMSSEDDLADYNEMVHDAVENGTILEIPEGLDRMFMQGYVGSLFDAWEDLENVSEGGLYNGRDVVETIAMISIQRWIEDIDNPFEYDFAVVQDSFDTIGSVIDFTSMDDGFWDLLGKARTMNYEDYLNELRKNSNLRKAYDNSGFGSERELFKFAQFVEVSNMVLDGTNRIIVGFSNMVEYEQARAFSSMIIYDLKQLGDSVYSYRLKNEINEYIETIDEGDLIESIQAWFGVDSMADGARVAIDSTNFMISLMEKGIFGEKAAKAVGLIAESGPVKMASKGMNVATLITDTPGLIVSLGGMDSNNVIECAISMNTIAQVYNQESEKLSKLMRESGTLTDSIETFRNMTILLRAWYQKCSEYMESATGWDVDIKREIKKYGLYDFEGDETIEAMEEIKNQMENLNGLMLLSDEEIVELLNMNY